MTRDALQNNQAEENILQYIASRVSVKSPLANLLYQNVIVFHYHQQFKRKKYHLPIT